MLHIKKLHQKYAILMPSTTCEKTKSSSMTWCYPNFRDMVLLKLQKLEHNIRSPPVMIRFPSHPPLKDLSSSTQSNRDDQVPRSSIAQRFVELYANFITSPPCEYTCTRATRFSEAKTQPEQHFQTCAEYHFQTCTKYIMKQMGQYIFAFSESDAEPSNTSGKREDKDVTV